jgi:hypothetical protein
MALRSSPDAAVLLTGYLGAIDRRLTDRGVPSDDVRVQMSTTTDQLRTHNLARTP